MREGPGCDSLPRRETECHLRASHQQRRGNGNERRSSDAWMSRTRAPNIGSAGGLTSASAPGARCARTTARTGPPGNIFPHDHARSRAYRWSEDGIAGICDRHQYVCFALALWNGRDPILKERLFGLTGNEGNHGEDVKEYYFYLDSTPTHSYMKFLYKYPQRGVPLRGPGGGEPPPRQARPGVRAARHRHLRRGPLFRRVRRVRQGRCRGHPDPHHRRQPRAGAGAPAAAADALVPQHVVLGLRGTAADAEGPCRHATDVRHRTARPGTTDNAGSTAKAHRSCCSPRTRPISSRLFGTQNASPYVKDGFNDYVVHGRRDAVNPAQAGTKAAAALRPSAGARARAAPSACG